MDVILMKELAWSTRNITKSLRAKLPNDVFNLVFQYHQCVREDFKLPLLFISPISSPFCSEQRTIVSGNFQEIKMRRSDLWFWIHRLTYCASWSRSYLSTSSSICSIICLWDLFSIADSWHSCCCNHCSNKYSLV